VFGGHALPPTPEWITFRARFHLRNTFPQRLVGAEVKLRFHYASGDPATLAQGGRDRLVGVRGAMVVSRDKPMSDHARRGGVSYAYINCGSAG